MTSDASRAVELLHDARNLVVFTGSGMSQESGIPTFRDEATGLWARFDPEELATPEGFHRHPARVFAWYLWRWRAIQAATPHAGYRALVELETRFDRMTVVTQNVDGLHARAGSRSVLELHGSLVRFRCCDGGHRYDARNLNQVSAAEAEEVEPPRCDRCGSLVRPDVVWFGEVLPWEQLEAARAAVDGCDALLVVGTAALVYPAAELAWVGVARGIPVIEINPQPTPLTSHVALSWRAGAGRALPELASALGAGLPVS